jgi:hypothetical protein
MKNKTKKSNYFKTNVSDMLVARGMPAFGTKEFNDMCSSFFTGKIKANLKKQL